MKKVFEFIIILIITFFGIGFIPYIAGILTIMISTLILLFPIANKDYFILACSIFLLMVYIPSNILNHKKFHVSEKNNISPKAIGILLALSSPVIAYSIGWILTAIFVFIVFSHSSTGLDRYLEKRTKNWSILIKDLTAGIAASIVLHTLYAGWLISPYVLAFLGKYV